MADHECLYSLSNLPNLERSLRFPSVSKIVPKVVMSVSKMFSEKSLKSSRKSAERFVVPTKFGHDLPMRHVLGNTAFSDVIHLM